MYVESRAVQTFCQVECLIFKGIKSKILREKDLGRCQQKRTLGYFWSNFFSEFVPRDSGISEKKNIGCINIRYARSIKANVMEGGGGVVGSACYGMPWFAHPGYFAQTGSSSLGMAFALSTFRILCFLLPIQLVLSMIISIFAFIFMVTGAALSASTTSNIAFVKSDKLRTCIYYNNTKPPTVDPTTLPSDCSSK